jgi:ATP-binding cassette subfamily B protein
MTDGGSADARALAGLQVLLVDDHEDTRLMMRAFLEHEGAVVLEADSAPAALATAAAASPAIVMTDVALGRAARDGLWLLDQLRATPRLAAIPVVAVTGHADRRAELRGRGFDDVMIKPIDLGEVGPVVRAAIAQRGGGPRG